MTVSQLKSAQDLAHAGQIAEAKFKTQIHTIWSTLETYRYISISRQATLTHLRHSRLNGFHHRTLVEYRVYEEPVPSLER